MIFHPNHPLQSSTDIPRPPRSDETRRGGALTRRQMIQALGGAGAALGIAGLGTSVVARQDATPSTGPAGPTAPSAPLIEPGAPTLQAKATELAFDLERIFRFVADEIQYDPYVGALRGPAGALWSLAGNSVDQALLLAALLDETLLPYRFAIGELDDAGADRLLVAATIDADAVRAGRRRADETAFALAPAPAAPDGTPIDPVPDEVADRYLAVGEEAISLANRLSDAGLRTLTAALADAGVTLPDPSAFTLPERERAQHVWVQVADGAAWIDLDPSIPGAAAGETLTTARETPAALPPELDHLVRLTLVAEEVIGGEPVRRDAVTYASPSRALTGIPVAVGAIAPESFKALGLALNQRFTGQTTFVPCIIAGSDGLYADVPIVFGAGDESETIAGALGGGTTSDGETLGLWLRVEITSPDASPVVVERSIFDRVPAAARATGEIVVAGISPVELVTLPDGGTIYPPLTTMRILTVAGAVLPSAYAITDQASPVTYGSLHLFGPSYLALRDALSLPPLATAGRRAFPDAPNVVAMEFGLATPIEPATDILARADLYYRRVAYAPLAVQAGQPSETGSADAVHPGLIFGVMSQVAERVFLDPVIVAIGSEIEPPGPDVETTGLVAGPSVGLIFELAAEQGIAVRTLLPGDGPDPPQGLTASPAASAGITAALAAGLVVVTPERPVAFDGAEITGWWTVNPATGETLDRLETGQSGASLSLRLPVAATLPEWANTVLDVLKRFKQLNCLGNAIGVVAGVGTIALVWGDLAKQAIAELATYGQLARAIHACR